MKRWVKTQFPSEEKSSSWFPELPWSGRVRVWSWCCSYTERSWVSAALWGRRAEAGWGWRPGSGWIRWAAWWRCSPVSEISWTSPKRNNKTKHLCENHCNKGIVSTAGSVFFLFWKQQRQSEITGRDLGLEVTELDPPVIEGEWMWKRNRERTRGGKMSTIWVIWLRFAAFLLALNWRSSSGWI